MYLAGIGVKKNAGKALYWLKNAARKGNILAMECLGWIYYEGKILPKNKVYARILFKEAANQSESARKSLNIVDGTMTQEEITQSYSVIINDIIK